MNELIVTQDAESRHRRWFNCINIPFDFENLIRGELEVFAHEQDLVFQSPEPIVVRDPDGNQLNAYVLGFRAGTNEQNRRNFPLAIQFLATFGGGEDDITIRSYFPVYDGGAVVPVKLTAIREWENGMEATLEGLMLDETREVIFYDTRYALFKTRYKVGETYPFRLAGFAHCAEILKSTKEKLSPRATEMLRRKMGEPIEKDAEGNVVPMTIDTKDMVAFVSRGGEYPDDHEFQARIRKVGDASHYTDKHHVIGIACARGDDDKVVEIPLIVNPALLGRTWPKPGQRIRGILWMQGHCAADLKH